MWFYSFMKTKNIYLQRCSNITCMLQKDIKQYDWNTLYYYLTYGIFHLGNIKISVNLSPKLFSKNPIFLKVGTFSFTWGFSEMLSFKYTILANWKSKTKMPYQDNYQDKSCWQHLRHFHYFEFFLINFRICID